jgi:hypothetical protein
MKECGCYQSQQVGISLPQNALNYLRQMKRLAHGDKESWQWKTGVSTQHVKDTLLHFKIFFSY